ncbi:MAG: TonB-dependent receptor domain-containing protein [Terriglobales bacterium]
MKYLSLLLLALPLLAQNPSLQLTITDENGIAVGGAIAAMQGPVALRCESDYAGRCRFTAPPGAYRLTVNKNGFYALNTQVRLPDTNRLDVTLLHTQEVHESVNVVASAPEIDPAETANTQTFGSREIINVPYPTTRDIREALPYIPGIVRDGLGQVHVAGASTYQTFDAFDGFNITNPATGNLDLRFSPDAVRSVDVQTSRYSAEFGPATGGLLAFTTGMGNDIFHIAATNFIPSVQNKKGIGLDKWTPRVTITGPIKKGKAWFLIAPEGEYDTNVIKELPDGADRSPMWRVSNLAKAQVNLSSSNILSATFLVNYLHWDYAGLSPQTPLSTTITQRQTTYFGSLRDQHTFSNGLILETGFAINEYRDTDLPLGTLPYVITRTATSGNFFESTRGSTRRIQGLTNLYLPPQHFAGRHDFKIGMDLERLDQDLNISRSPISILRADNALFSRITFTGPALVGQSNVQLGAYAQDRWSPTPRLLIETGVRFDRDHITPHTAVSPRVAATYMLDDNTKFTAGIGLFHDLTLLDFTSRTLFGPRLQTIFAADGVTPTGPPLPTSFTVDRASLLNPRFLNWSIGVQRRLPGTVIFTAEYLRKRGANEFTFINASTTPFIGDYRLVTTRQDHYDALQFTARRVFHNDHEIMLAYTRSRAVSNAVLGFSIDNPIFSQQGPGPLPWDAPNQLVSWGYLPIPHFKKWDIALSSIWRSGFAWSAVNQDQQIVGAPDSHRFPDFFTLNLFLERRFSFRGYNLALRGGFEDITDRPNPAAVYNNVDSPLFGQFALTDHRAFTARIRFLGRKK